MAARNTAESKRFIHRAANNEVEPFYVPITSSGSVIPDQRTMPSLQAPSLITQSADAITTRAGNETPVRRVVLIRNSKNPQVHQGPVDIGDLTRPSSLNTSPRFTDGNKSIFLIRRPIVPSDIPKPAVVHQSTFQDPSLTTSLEYIRTPSPTNPAISQEVISSSDPPRSPSGRIKSSKHPEQTHRSPSPDRIHSRRRRRRSPSTSPESSVKQEDSPKTIEKQNSFSYYSIKNFGEPIMSPLSAIDEDERHIVEHRPKTRKQTGRRMKSAKSVRSISTNTPAPDDQSTSTVDNSSIREEPLKPIIKRPRSIKKTRFEDDINDGSTDALVKANRWETCLRCLSRYMCLILIISFLLILIGLAGVGVSAYFLATNSSNNLVPTAVGIAIGGFLAITALCFLCILLACIGSREDYFTYNGDGPRIGGRAFAMIPPTHSNAHLYIPRDFMKMIENGYPVSRISTAKRRRRVTSSVQRRSATTLSNGHETKSTKNITIEMPEGLLTGGSKSARERELNLNKMVKNIGQIVEDTKKRYHGDLPDKVIVKVDKDAVETA